MSERLIVGLKPWLPEFLRASPWWVEPIRAERLAAFRIGIATVLLLDIVATYLPGLTDFFGPASLGSPEVFAGRRDWPRWNWSVLSFSPAAALWAVPIWTLAAAFLLAGYKTRLSAAVTWMLSVSVLNLNYYIHNGGDRVRTVALFYLIFCPCAAVWSVDRWRKKGVLQKLSSPVYVHPWAVRLLFVQMTVIYFFSGVFKLMGREWLRGETMHYLFADFSWTRFPHFLLPIPAWPLALLTWTVLVWEVGFPLLVWRPWTRKPTLWLGVAFHVGTAISLELGTFPLYMLCFYLPLIPWEKYVDAWRGRQPNGLNSEIPNSIL